MLLDDSQFDPATWRIEAIGADDDDPEFTYIERAGRSRRPLTPVHPRVALAPSGAMDLGWTRRVSGSWYRLERVDIPMIEQSELCDVGVGDEMAPIATWLCSNPEFQISADQLAGLAAQDVNASIWVRQIGSYAKSASLLLATIGQHPTILETCDVPPLTYSSRNARHNLPFLFVGQAQKEAYVNEAFTRLDLLVNPSVESISIAPPDAPGDGALFIVATWAIGEWSGHDGELAGWQAGAWLYQKPFIGCRVYDVSSGAVTVDDGQWRSAQTPNSPSGGSTIDNEAHSAIDTLILRLRELGIFSAT